MIDLDAIRHRMVKGTRGKSWAFQAAGHWRFRIPPVFDRHQREFIGHAPDDIRALLAELEQCRAALAPPEVISVSISRNDPHEKKGHKSRE